MAECKYVSSESLHQNSRFLYLKDIYATKILSDERNRDYLLKVISAATGLDLDPDSFDVVSTRLGLSNGLVNNIADIVVKDDHSYYNVEINYSHNPITDFKNMCYICELFLRQLKSKTPKVYSKIKKVLQININGYDRFSQGKFIYTSHISEDALHQIRNDCLKIVDINLDFLAEMNYNNLEKYESDSLERLLYVFVCNNKDVLDKVYVGDEIMEKVKDQLYDLDENLDNYLFYDREEYMKESLYSTGLVDGEAKGLEKGLKQGREEGFEQGELVGQRKIIIRMLEDMTIEEVSKLTKLPIEEIEKIVVSSKDEEECS